MEAFMYRFHPQWETILPLISDGSIGNVKYVHSMFSYHNTDAMDIRNQANIGGGGLLDIGCYTISVSRFLFGSEPRRVLGSVEYDPTFRIDRLAGGILEFENGIATFACSTQLEPRQHAEVFGTRGRVDIPCPFFPAGPDNRTTIIQQTGSERKEIIFDACNQYMLQADKFSLAILNDTPVPIPLADAMANMRVIDGIFESSQRGGWVAI
jgi:predicted dehydrogenase